MKFRLAQYAAALTLFVGGMICAENGAEAADPPAGAVTEPVNEDLVAEANLLASNYDFRATIEKIDEILARPGGRYNPVLNAWHLTRYGDLQRASSLLLPILAEKNAFAQHVNIAFEPLISGTLAYSTGDWSRARELLRRAVDQFTVSQTLDRYPDIVKLHALDLLARGYREQGEHRASMLCIQEMRAVLKTRGFSNEQDMYPDLSLAELHLAKGNTVDADEALKALEARTALKFKMPTAFRARMQKNMGLVATRKRQWSEARRLLEDALKIEEAVYIDFHPSVIETLRYLTNLSVVADQIDDAVKYANRAAELADKRARHVLRLGSERQKRIAARMLEHDADVALSLHLQHAQKNPAAARLALTTILRRKGMIFDAMVAGTSAMRQQPDPQGQTWAKEMANLSAQMSTMISRGPVDVTLEDYQNDLFDLEEQRRRLEERLVGLGNKGGKSKIDDAPLLQLADVQRALPEGAALVELFEYRPYRPFGPPVHSTWGNPRLVAYILHKTGEPTFVELGQTGVTNPVAMKLLQELSSGGNHRQFARELDRFVMEPVRKALGQTRWIFLSPDGALNFIPFYALVDETDHELVESMSMTNLLAGRDLLRLEKSSPAPRQSTAIFANPDFDQTIERTTEQVTQAQSRAVDLSRVYFSPLAGTAAEGLEVQKTMSDALLLTGANATEEAIKELHGPRILHIATHGFFLPDITDVTGNSAKTEPDPWNANPLLRSGLALRGANRRKSQTDREDGVLTALEVSHLDLQGTRLVVLSACETGVGQALRGEGVYGLQRAMTMAGAETQVTSLWQVDDQATKKLMVAFYEQLAKGMGRGEAMRLAQLSVRQSQPHPFYWASFVVAGNAGTLDGKSQAPDPARLRVFPGGRGCACRVSESGDSKGALGVAIALAAIAGMRRGRRVQEKTL